ncbi:hypothetical protein [Leptospira sarikeiensis]|uniref:Uncharacterized protein n=1 Tax=Leptospira sarikeiensis TaxID=2484943 RepID=A0A4R9KB36_9LEPT|nr:hypothetical protein [Leptospira sarikeiensis]TGL62024.1 hypothetical protein EHQ64_09155 [Leptospira sarikeiensis]
MNNKFIIKWVFLIVGILASSILYVDLAADLGGAFLVSGIYGFAYIISFLMILIGIFQKLTGKKAKTLGRGLSIFIFMVPQLFISTIISQYQVKWSLERGETIIAAIDKYKSENNGMPISLEELVPNYMDKIPNTLIGLGHHSFEYRKIREEYVLLFDIFPAKTKVYGFNDRYWIEYD